MRQFEQTSWVLDEEDIEIKEQIGVGQFGEVFRGVLHGKEVAVKRLLPQSITEDVLEEVWLPATFSYRLGVSIRYQCACRAACRSYGGYGNRSFTCSSNMKRPS